jgi:glucose-fructose oxidoreductase
MKTPRPSSRRLFLEKLSFGFAALALAARSRAAEAAPGARKLGVALCGLGNYSRGQLGPALRLTQNCRLAGVVTGSPEKGRQWARDYGFPEKNIWSYDTMAQMADNQDIDIVYVVTPNALHARDTIAAAKAGKHVICEKPMAISVAECDAMIAACRAAKVKLSIGYRLHFDPYHRELKRLAHEKDLGAFMQMSGANGFRMGRKVWRADHKLSGGGPLMDMGIYCVQAAFMANDEGRCVAVTAREHPKTRPEIFADVEEGLDWTMEFESGAKAELMSSYNRNDGRFRAEAAKGWANFEPAFGYNGIRAATSAGPMPFPPLPSQQAVQIDAFAAAVRDNTPSIVPGEMGRRDMCVIEAIYAAMSSGKRERVRA